VFVAGETPNHLGCVAETAIALEAMRLGVEVYKPMSEHARADLVFGVGDGIYRVQCKSARRQGDTVVVRFVSTWLSNDGYVRRRYSSAEIDFFAAHCHELDQNFLIPIALVDGHSGITLRLAPARNAQRASLHFASDFALSGAVAQLGERLRGTQEAVGSSPISSTSPEPAPTTVGAHEFRNRFGWYMERAAAGEEIRVTRRGRPYVRVSRPA
jgi:hypothetical protein